MNQRGEDGLLSRWLEERGKEERKAQAAEKAEAEARETLGMHALQAGQAGETTPDTIPGGEKAAGPWQPSIPDSASWPPGEVRFLKAWTPQLGDKGFVHIDGAGRIISAHVYSEGDQKLAAPHRVRFYINRDLF